MTRAATTGAATTRAATNRVGISIHDVTRNPVLRRELAERAASTRAAVAVTLWLVLLSGLATLVYFAYTNVGEFDPVSTDSAAIGKDLFEWTLFGMMGLVLFLVPAFTASAVAGERTRQTLIPVQMTALSPFAIVLGKSLAAIAFTVLLVVLAAPILAVAFLIGGVGLGDMAKAIAMIVLTAVMLGAVGIMFSSILRKVQSAIVMTYGFVLALAVGTFILLGAWAVIEAVTDEGFNDPEAPPKELVAVNPFVALADYTAGPDVELGSNPLTGLRVMLQEIDQDRLGPGETEATSVWRWYVVFVVLMTFIAMHVATGGVRTPAAVER